MACPLTDCLATATNHNHTHQEVHEHKAPVVPRTPSFYHWDLCYHHSESNALPTELRDRQSASVDEVAFLAYEQLGAGNYLFLIE